MPVSGVFPTDAHDRKESSEGKDESQDQPGAAGSGRRDRCFMYGINRGTEQNGADKHHGQDQDKFFHKAHLSVEVCVYYII